MFGVIGWIIFGFIVGLIARALMPGRQHMGMLTTTILGIIGALLGGWFGQAVGWYNPGEGAGFIVATLGAIVVLTIYHLVARRTSVTDQTSSSRDRWAA